MSSRSCLSSGYKSGGGGERRDCFFFFSSKLFPANFLIIYSYAPANKSQKSHQKWVSRHSCPILRFAPTDGDVVMHRRASGWYKLLVEGVEGGGAAEKARDMSVSNTRGLFPLTAPGQ